MDNLLTERELTEKIWELEVKSHKYCSILEIAKHISKFTHQKDIEWLEEPCTEHFPPSWRRLCPLCWKEFKEAGR